jgi:hypothetical protein
MLSLFLKPCVVNFIDKGGVSISEIMFDNKVSGSIIIKKIGVTYYLNCGIHSGKGFIPREDVVLKHNGKDLLIVKSYKEKRKIVLKIRCPKEIYIKLLERLRYS